MSDLSGWGSANRGVLMVGDVQSLAGIWNVNTDYRIG